MDSEKEVQNSKGAVLLYLLSTYRFADEIEDAATKENALTTKMIRRFRPVGSAPASGATLSEGHYSHSGSLLVFFQRA